MSKEMQEFEETAAKLLAAARQAPPAPYPQHASEETYEPEPMPRRGSIPTVFKILAGLAIVALSFLGTMYLMDIYYPVPS